MDFSSPQCRYMIKQTQKWSWPNNHHLSFLESDTYVRFRLFGKKVLTNLWWDKFNFFSNMSLLWKHEEPNLRCLCNNLIQNYYRVKKSEIQVKMFKFQFIKGNLLEIYRIKFLIKMFSRRCQQVRLKISWVK